MVGPKRAEGSLRVCKPPPSPIGPSRNSSSDSVESGKRNSLSHLDSEGVARLPIEFIDEIQHLDVDLYAQLLRQ